jgi:hypothetical protein
MVGLRSVGLGRHDGERESILGDAERRGGEERMTRGPWEERRGEEINGGKGEGGEGGKEVEKKVED